MTTQSNSHGNQGKDGWITDDNGNKCSIEYFGSEQAAREALESLTDCRNCVNCSDCSDCSRCSGCSYCSDKRGNQDAERPPVPRIENIHQAVYAAASQPDALNMGNWHTCEKKHCWGGWTVALAGEAGRVLERYYNTELAARLIYRESGYQINPARFYDTNEAALAEMRRLAEDR